MSDDAEILDVEDASNLHDEQINFKKRLTGTTDQRIRQNNDNLSLVLQAVKTHTIVMAIKLCLLLFLLLPAITRCCHAL